MPHLHQSKAAECGLACLAMEANHHGWRTGLASLRRRFPVSLKGAILQTVLVQGGSEQKLRKAPTLDAAE